MFFFGQVKGVDGVSISYGVFRAYTEMVRVIPREEYIVSISYGVFRAYTGTPKKANAGRLS